MGCMHHGVCGCLELCGPVPCGGFVVVEYRVCMRQGVKFVHGFVVAVLDVHIAVIVGAPAAVEMGESWFSK